MKMIKITKIVAVVAALCLVFPQAVPLGYASFFSDMAEQATQEMQQPTVSAEPVSAVQEAVDTVAQPYASTTTDFLSGSSALSEEDTAAAPAEALPQEIGAMVDDVLSRMADAGLEQDLSQTLDYISNGDYVSVVEFQNENPEILNGLISSLQMIPLPESTSVAVPDIPDINVNIESSLQPPPGSQSISDIGQVNGNYVNVIAFPKENPEIQNRATSSLPTPSFSGSTGTTVQASNGNISLLPTLPLPDPTEVTTPASNGNISSLPTPSLAVSTGTTVQGSNGDIGSLRFPVSDSIGATVQALNRDINSLSTLSLPVSTGATVPASNGNISLLQTLPVANSPSATFPKFVKGWLEEARGVRGALLVSQQGIGN